MSRITCKSCRRLGESLCGREKCAYKKRPYAPGILDSQRKHRSSTSEYGEQLKAKQKMKISYGLTENQFSSFVKKIMQTKDSSSEALSPSLKIYNSLESRLDNMVFRAGFASGRSLARQIVSHGHITVNGRRLNIPSHKVKIGDVIAIREGSKALKVFTGLSEKLTNTKSSSNVLAVDPTKLEAKVTGTPREVEPMFDVQKVLEFYSR